MEKEKKKDSKNDIRDLCPEERIVRTAKILEKPHSSRALVEEFVCGWNLPPKEGEKRFFHVLEVYNFIIFNFFRI